MAWRTSGYRHSFPLKRCKYALLDICNPLRQVQETCASPGHTLDCTVSHPAHRIQKETQEDSNDYGNCNVNFFRVLEIREPVALEEGIFVEYV